LDIEWIRTVPSCIVLWNCEYISINGRRFPHGLGCAAGVFPGCGCLPSSRPRTNLFPRRPHHPQPLADAMPSPIALTSPPRQESIFKKRSPSYLTAMRSAQSYLMALSEADARSRSRDSASTTSTPALSLSSSATTLSEDDVINDTPYDNSDGLAYPMTIPTSEQFSAVDHLQFGFCVNENYRYRSAHRPGTQVKDFHEQDPPYYILITTYLGYLFLICIGHLRDFFGKRLHPAFYRHLLPFDVSYPSGFRSVISGAGLFGLFITPNSELSPSRRVMLPLIRTSIPSTLDGSRHV